MHNPKARSILVIGETPADVAYMQARLKGFGCRVSTAFAGPGAARKAVEEKALALFIGVDTDITTIAAAVHAERGRIPVIAFGRAGNPQAAAKSIARGAVEFVGIPADDAFLRAVLDAAVPEPGQFLHRDPKSSRIVNLAHRVAASDVPLLIIGETGTGKEVLAHEVHRVSKRRDGPFISINCAAIPDTLLESELFGYEKGAFTGATQRRIGKFEEANGGTLLLDEIGEMELRLQAKLLRALQERQIDRIGTNQSVSVDIRILATTNRDLEVEVKAGRFREDLFYRLNVINIVLPPLRERTGDIPVLVDFFLSKYADIAPFGRCTLGEDAQEKLMSYNWPGNVRELENTIYRAALLASGPVVTANEVILTSEQKTYYQALLESSTPLSSPQPSTWHSAVVPQPGAAPPSAYAANVAAAKGFAQPDATPPVASLAPEEDPDDPSGSATIGTFVGQTIAAVEQELILATLDRCLGNRTQAAHILGISIQTLRNKLDRYGA